MPVTLTYPGVYVEEIPSGVHTITGVATSIAAFVGQTAKGSTNDPTTVYSYSDFEQNFGGLTVGMTLGFAVRDFFLNGGSEAIIVRLVAAPPPAALAGPPPPVEPGGAPAAPVAAAAKAAQITLPGAGGQLVLLAASAGSWGNALTAAVDYSTQPVAAGANRTIFNLTLIENRSDGSAVAIEKYLNASIDPASPNYLTNVLANQSSLAVVSPALAGMLPLPNATANPVVADGSGNDGGALQDTDLIGGAGDTFLADKRGLYALAKTDIFNLLCIPPYTFGGTLSFGAVTAAVAYCTQRGAMMIVDAPAGWTSAKLAVAGAQDLQGNVGALSRNAAIFFPRLIQPNPLLNNQMQEFVACGAVAGVFARTDAQRGVWKAPAGVDATLINAPQLSVPLHDGENGDLNPLGVNCLRAFPVIGRVVWGARTTMGADVLTDDYKYVPVRRLALYIEASLYQGTQWVVFEPNDEPLWAQIRLNVGAFMQNLFRQGAFQGQTPQDAYFVKCDKESTTQNDIDLGIVNIIVGFCPLKPAEFVVIQLQQIAGQIQV